MRRYRVRPRFVLAAALLSCLPCAALVAQAPFRRGEVAGEAGIGIADALQVLRFLFGVEGAALTCQDAADADDDGDLDLGDALYLLGFLFRDGPAPLDPFRDCGTDATMDGLGCEASRACPAGDGFFFVIDRSGGSVASGGLEIARREVLRSIEEFSSSVQFGIVFFDLSVIKFPQSGRPVQATDEIKALAMQFIQGISGGSGSCVRSGLTEGLDFAERSTAGRNAVIYLGDGGGTCQGMNESAYLSATLDAVTERNAGRFHINAIGVGSGALNPLNESFLRMLAGQNRGTYTRIAR